MKIATLNIAKRLFKAEAPIRELIEKEAIDILCLQETDLQKERIPPILQGYRPVVHTNSAGVSRAITYVKNNIKFAEVVGHEKMIPHVIIKLRDVTIINVYNEFSSNSYSNNSRKLSKPEQVRKYVEVFDLASNHVKSKVIWIGDMNLNVLNRKESREYLEFCEDNGLVHENWSPTRGNACLDHVVTRNVAPHDIILLETGLSDHKMITLKLGKKQPEKVLV